MDLQTIWFLLWALLWAVFFLTDGFDFGVGTLLPFLGRTDEDRRIMLNSVGPVWDGNEVWLITAGGVTFAAFPKVYAVMFSSLYSALMLILFTLIIRGVSFEFRSKVDSPRWRQVWDTAQFLGSLLPAVLFGVAFANIFRGIPIDKAGIYQGNLLTLLNPYGLLGGALFLLMFVMHGALWLNMKTTGVVKERAGAVVSRLWPVLTLVAVIFLVASWFSTRLYTNYIEHPVLFLIILLAVTGLFAIPFFQKKGKLFSAWVSSAVFIAGATFFGVIGLFPYLFPSSIDPAFGLTIHNASSSPLTLKIMLVVVLLFIPLVIAYQIWSHRLFRHPIGEDDLGYEEAY